MGMIRVLLALFVVVAHTETFFDFSFTGGQVAVELFFIISGFYMTMILNEKYIGEGSYLPFIKNRFLKIYPMYWAVLLFTVIAFIVLLLAFHNDEGFRFYVDNFYTLDIKTILFIFSSNLLIFGQDIMMFLGIDQVGSLIFTNDFSQTSPYLYQSLFIPQAWTLGIELTFYLIAPFIVRRSISFIFLLIFLSLIIRFFIYTNLNLTNDPWVHRFFLSELGLFLFGTLAYHVYKKYNIENKFFLSGIYMVILLNLILYEFIYKDVELLNNWYLYILFSISLAYIFQLFKNSRIDSIIGEFSYPIYLSHVAVMGMVNFILRKFGYLEYLAELTFLGTVLFSYLLIKFLTFAPKTPINSACNPVSN